MLQQIIKLMKPDLEGEFNDTILVWQIGRSKLVNLAMILSGNNVSALGVVRDLITGLKTIYRQVKIIYLELSI